MRTLPTRLPAIRSQALVTFILLGIGVFVAYNLGGWIAGGQLQQVVLLGLLAALGGVSIVILRNWRSGFYLFMIWLVFEDLIRKYLGNNMAIYFAKDVLILLTLISLYISTRRGKAPKFRPPFMFLLGIFIWLGVLQVFNINSPSILYGLLGLKLYFAYIPLMFVGYALIQSDEDLRRFLLLIMSLAGVVSILGITQAIIGRTFLNPVDLDPTIKGLSQLERSAPLTGELINIPTSVFVSAGRYGWYLELVTMLGIATIAYLLLTRLRGRFIAFTAMGLIAVATLLSGSRGAIVFGGTSAIVISLGLLWGGRIHLNELKQMFKALGRAAFVAVAAMCLAVLIFPKQVGSRLEFYTETLNPNSSRSELELRSWDYPVKNLLLALSEPNWLLGNGIGTASLGVQYVSAYLHEAALPIEVENGYGTLIVELGILGPFLWVIWSAAMVISLWRVTRQVKGTPYFPIALSVTWLAFMVLFPYTFGGLPAYQNYVVNAYLWIFVGVVFRLPVLAARPLPAIAAPVRVSSLPRFLGTRVLPAR
jgi:hypothetical protein